MGILPERARFWEVLFWWRGPTLQEATLSPGPETHRCPPPGRFCLWPCKRHHEKSAQEQGEMLNHLSVWINRIWNRNSIDLQMETLSPYRRWTKYSERYHTKSIYRRIRCINASVSPQMSMRKRIPSHNKSERRISFDLSTAMGAIHSHMRWSRLTSIRFYFHTSQRTASKMKKKRHGQ